MEGWLKLSSATEDRRYHAAQDVLISSSKYDCGKVQR